MWSEQRHDGNRLIFIRLSLGVVLSHGVAGLLVVKDALDQRELHLQRVLVCGQQVSLLF